MINRHMQLFVTDNIGNMSYSGLFLGQKTQDNHRQLIFKRVVVASARQWFGMHKKT
jgi:hypothetical protein